VDYHGAGTLVCGQLMAECNVLSPNFGRRNAAY
jgi:hypothetical protein